MFDQLNEPIIDLHLKDLASVSVGSSGGSHLMLILPLIASLVISMVIIPVMVRLAPRLGMIDRPDPRKVHAVPIPRVGGVGIVLGALLPVILLLPLDPSLKAYIFGALVLFGFGVMDDCRELGHYVKFIGQFIAVIAVVYYGDVFVTHLPFMGGEPVSAAVGRPFTVFAMVGMINAMNHSDGLDGLAGGESLLSLGGIAYLSYLAGGTAVSLIAFATIGGLFGFMRFNTYPARIFMGDGGSHVPGLYAGISCSAADAAGQSRLESGAARAAAGSADCGYHRCLCAADLPQGKLVPRHQKPHPSSPAESRIPAPRIRHGCLFGAGAAGVLCGAHAV